MWRSTTARWALPAGFSPYLLRRHPEFWPNPEELDPQRFLPGSASTRLRCAYLPFGGGRRICVGADWSNWSDRPSGAEYRLVTRGGAGEHRSLGDA